MRRDLERRSTNRSERLPVSRRSMFAPWYEDFLRPTRWFDDFFGRELWPVSDETRFVAPAIDIDETEEEYLVCADLPGIKREDIQIESLGNQLTISAERKYEGAEGRRRDRQERFYGSYQRSFTLPTGVEMDKIRAEYEEGVLTVHIPKGEKAKSRRIEIAEGKSKPVEIKSSKH